ncbi:hypothetical protein A3H38_02375 [candidate division WOR-1 bacterium RIFCSPLOWO2_02_FULL_46_20]|uniref:DNA-binding protein n=2 Tax=Saganbacteria TaxID=1703751 RepID=A0A1F4R8N9_UNCSA|nr:MAG: hypothetical protein A3J44_05460 [candidate division WOR-1 bacterium RIFCSPHIGHO2_02_FULL_45_12]OGC04544.1 MAG: hypothetical protein A3H38_02375 [candidate division WOR-1 bacterium RIFCSPLOWO2_02_FULL_46_20]OGC09326.1 MAG: hypothetical protein A3F86_00545 [candidate division WOR-1 bacterium RIFCSPLOWO2_12_FULL_45_9]
MFCFLLLGNCAAAAAVSSNDLIAKAHIYDGRTIEFTGEVVGDVMIRGDFAWLNINDGAQAIGVWTNKQAAEKISYVGDYTHIGDTVKVAGQFHRACPQHGGDLDIHATEILISKQGHKVKHTVNNYKFAMTVILLLAIVAVSVWSPIKKPK